MREKLLSIGDDFWIENGDGERAFKVNGKALRVRSTFILESPSGEELYKIQEKKLHVRDTMEVERDGETVAKVQKALITPLRERGGRRRPVQKSALCRERQQMLTVAPNSS